MFRKLQQKLFPRNPHLGSQRGERRKALRAGRLVVKSEVNSNRLRHPELVANLRKHFDIDPDAR